MNRAISLICLIAALSLLLPGVAWGREPTASLVSVIGLDGQGKPQRQGMGLIRGKGGRILTSASLLSQEAGGIVKTASGDLHLITAVLYRDDFQDLALVRTDQEISPGPAVPWAAAGPRPPEKVWVGVRRAQVESWQEAEVTKIYPFSPRLNLMKLEPPTLAAEPGSPVLNRRGELIGMLHAFGASPTCKFFLLRDRNLLPEGNQDQAGPPGKFRQVPESGQAGHAAFWQGVAASLEQRWPEARQAFSEALSPSGQLPEAYYGRGVARYHQGDFAGAALDLEAATRLLPGYGLASLRLGEALERLGKREAARASYVTASQASPDMDEAWFHLGEMAYRDGDLQKARKYLEQAGGAFPAQRWWYLGAIARAERHWPEALEAFGRASQHDPKLFQAYLDRGSILVQDLGRPAEAVGILAEAVRLEPRRPQARYYLGLANLMSSNHKGAWEQYFALQGLSPSWAAHLANILERQP